MAKFIPSSSSSTLAELEAAQQPPAAQDDDLEVQAHVSVGGILVAGLLVGVPTLLVAPWIVKQFKPEWSYGKRVATGMAASFVGGVLSRGLRSTDQ